jgi:hypothetical protein
MAEYMLFIWEDEAAFASADQAAAEAILADHEAFIAQNGAVLRGGNRLHPSLAATSVRRTADEGVAVSDGAFAETKEAIGGYYLIDVPDLDEALRIAAQVPAPFGGVEIRPVWPAGGTQAG